jgi:gamma-glutamyl:cysteine ligase YbdK (ATP-grasp superfamily)
MEDMREALQSEEEQSMREAFENQAEEVLEKKKLYRNSNNNFKIGLETEYPAVDEEDFEPIDREVRNQVIEGLDFADVEVGASQIELRTDPMRPDSLAELENEMRSIEAELHDEAAVRDVNVFRAATNPFVNLESIERTDQPKYDRVPSFHNQYRNSDVQDRFGRDQTIDPHNAGLPAVINSTQVNVEAQSLEDAVDKANYTYMMSPFLSAISGNARFLDGKDLGFSDIRMPLWEKSHDIRTDEQLGEETMPVGKIGSYFQDIEDYFSRAQDLPFVLHDEEEALDIGIGTFWKDTRIKFPDFYEKDGYSAVVESRIVSTQPTLEEEVAMHGFFLGRLSYAQEKDENLMEIEKVNRNRYAAMHNGLDTKLYGTDGELRDAAQVLEEELEKAKIGLENADIEYSGYMDLLYDRLEEGTPADLMAEGFNNARQEGLDRDQALKRGLDYQVKR